jgi:predicted nucleotidyltransferase
MSPAADIETPNVDVEGMCEYLSRQDLEFAVLFGPYAREESDSASDVDIVLGFRRRNRIDAELQAYADAFVDVSDIKSLPASVARNALREGIRLAGSAEAVDEYRERIETDHDAESAERERQAFINRLARGDV